MWDFVLIGLGFIVCCVITMARVQPRVCEVCRGTGLIKGDRGTLTKCYYCDGRIM